MKLVSEPKFVNGVMSVDDRIKYNEQRYSDLSWENSPEADAVASELQELYAMLARGEAWFTNF